MLSSVWQNVFRPDLGRKRDFEIVELIEHDCDLDLRRPLASLTG